MQILEEAVEENEKNVSIAESDNVVEVTSPSVDDLDSEPGFFIRPMLKPGHEGELCEWLKEMGLLKRSMKCINSIDNVICNTVMHWNHARILDKYQWICHKCNAKRSIRDNTAFKQMKCSLATALRIILGWCKNIEMEEITEILHVKLFVVKKVYEICTSIIMVYFQIHKNEFKFGGLNSLVIVDMFPALEYNDKINCNSQDNNNSFRSVLCIGEIKEIPTQFYFHSLNLHGSTFMDNIINEAVIKIDEIVKPGTIIVLNSKLPNEFFVYLRKCNKYGLVIGTDDLAKYDTPMTKTLAENVNTIWLPAKNISDEAQNYGNDMNSFLIEQMWFLKFGLSPSTAFEYLMHNFNDCWESQFPNLD